MPLMPQETKRMRNCEGKENVAPQADGSYPSRRSQRPERTTSLPADVVVHLGGREQAHFSASSVGDGREEIKAQANIFRKTKVTSNSSLMKVSFLNMAGLSVAVLDAAPTDTPYELSQQLEHRDGIRGNDEDDTSSAVPISFKLVHGSQVLDDDRSLQDQGVTGPDVTLSLVVVQPPLLARILFDMRNATLPDEVVSSALADVCGPAARNMFLKAEKHRPVSRVISWGFPSGLARPEFVCWMSQALCAMQFGEAPLHSAVHTLDRYLASLAAPMEPETLGKTIVGAISLALKAAIDSPGHTAVLKHLIRVMPPLNLPDVFKMEQAMFRSLGFIVTAPTPLDFLHGLGVVVANFHDDRDVARWLRLGTFLLELALLDEGLGYRFPHAILAAAALHAAMQTLEAPREAMTWCVEALHDYAPQLSPADVMVETAVGDICMHWASCSSETRFLRFFRHAQQKFSRDGLLSAAELTPPENYRQSHNPQEPGEEIPAFFPPSRGATLGGA